MLRFSYMDKAKILVVEDDEFLREVYIEILSGEGYTVDTAADGETGMDKIKNGGFNIVLLDIILPQMNGLDIVRKLKSENTFPAKCVVIFLTNLDKDEEIKQALQLGDGYLIKSQLTPGDLIKEVELFLSKQASSVAKGPVVPPAAVPPPVVSPPVSG